MSRDKGRVGKNPEKKGGTGRAYKRKFRGNKYTLAKQVAESEVTKTPPVSPEKKAPTASEWKLQAGPSSAEPTLSDVEMEILAFTLVFPELSKVVSCKTCGGDVEFLNSNHQGLGFKIVVQCKGECDKHVKTIGSCLQIGKQKNQFCVNRRIVLAMRLIGVGRAGTERFCSVMDLPPPPAQSSYNRTVVNLKDASEAVCEASMAKAAKAESELSEFTEGKVKVSGDGSWRRRGFKSNYGIQTWIGYKTKKVLDVNIKSAYCNECVAWEKKSGTPEYEEWLDQHEEQCKANHHGSAGAMEPVGIVEMFKRSKEKHNLIYSHYIGDGDSKTYREVCTAKPYEEDNIEVTKLECVGHVQKRVGAQLRQLVKGDALQDGKKAGGKGRLSEVVISDLQLRYGNTIRANPGSVEKMQQAIWAAFHHIFTDQQPSHEFCPEGPASWCKYQRAKHSGTLKDFKHTRNIPDVVKNAVLPIFEKLSSYDLLVRCLGGHTQNSNESMNKLIWALAPKHMSSGLSVVQIATFLSVAMFNEGNTSILNVMKNLGTIPVKRARAGLEAMDKKRLSDASRAADAATKEARMKRYRKRKADEESDIDNETVFYMPGGDLLAF